jgi:NAD(P)-dependent dehydrogenase (short-subunit alcohol dehydrogenase family)
MTVNKYNKIAIVTGANGGVGFGICQRLLEAEGTSLTLVMACRNPTRAKNAREKLLQQFPYSNIDIELVDVGSVKSVISFSAAIKDK